MSKKTTTATTTPTWRDLSDAQKINAAERVCPCGRHALTVAHRTKYANKACSMRAYHVARAVDAAAGKRAPEKGRKAPAQRPAKGKPTAAPVKGKAPAQRPAKGKPTAAPAVAAPAPAPTPPAPTAPAPTPPIDRAARGRDELLTAARAVDAPPAARPIEVVDLTPAPASLTPQGKPTAGKISDAIRAVLGLPATRLLFYVKPGVVPTWCRRRRWRGGWRLSSDRRTFLGRNLGTIRAACEGFVVDSISGRLTLTDGTPLPNVTLDHVRTCRAALTQARYALNLPSSVTRTLALPVPYGRAGAYRGGW